MHVDGIENCTLQYVSTFILILSLCVPIIILGLEGACICVCDRQGDEKLQIEIVLAYLDII